LQVGWQDGAITASVGVELLVGVEFEVSVNPKKVGETVIYVGETFVAVGKTSYTWAGDGADFVIYTAGPGVYDAAKQGAEDASKIAKTVAGDAIRFFDQSAEDLEQAFFIFAFDQNQALDVIFDELESIAEDVAKGLFPAPVNLIRGGEVAFDAAKSVYRYLRSLF